MGEEEQDVTDLGKLESGMEAAVKGLKWEYANSITARITPGVGSHIWHVWNHSGVDIGTIYGSYVLLGSVVEFQG